MISDAITLAKNSLVKPWEGYHRKLPDGRCMAYPDPGSGADPWTIGWGSTGPGIASGSIWTEAQAEEALDKHLLYFASGVLSLSPGLAKEPPRRLAAIISFAYNCGLRNYRISTLRKRVDAKDWLGAAEQILRWNKAGGRVLRGLTRRRGVEAEFLR